MHVIPTDASTAVIPCEVRREAAPGKASPPRKWTAGFRVGFTTKATKVTKVTKNVHLPTWISLSRRESETFVTFVTFVVAPRPLRMTKRLAPFALALIVACGGAPKDTAQTAQPSADSKPLAIGDTVPALHAVTLTGDSAVIGGPNASLTLVNVWATWCTSCREEMADLEAIYKESAPKGLRVIAVSVDAGSEDLVKRYVDHEKLTFPVVHDRDGKIQTKYQIMGIPATYLVGKDGHLLWQRTGGIHGATAEARTAIAAALK